MLVCSVGTEIFFQAEFEAPEADAKWAAELDRGWQRQRAVDLAAAQPQLEPQVFLVMATTLFWSEV